MRFEELKARLQPLVPDDLEALWRAFRAEGGTEADAFAERLLASGHLGEAANATLAELRGSRARVGNRTWVEPGEGPPPSVDDPARTRTGGFAIFGKLGEGAMGEVLLARDVDLHRVVAYKKMSPEIDDQPVLASRFRSEVQITAQLEHPNIVPVYSLEYAADGTLAYTMKRIEGRTLEQLLDEARAQWSSHGKVDEDHDLDSLLEVFIQVCEALAYAHSRGVVHRDLKPENIMIGAYSQVYVMDWGIARPMASVKVGAPVLLDEPPVPEGELLLGTPQYMSPEQAHGRHDALDGRSDQYALGLILYEIVSLTKAVTGKTALKIVMRQQDGDKNPIQHVHPKGVVAPELAAIVAKATALEERDRYSDVAALADDIRRFRRGEAVLAHPDGLAQRLGRWVSRHRQLTLFGVIIVLLLSVGGTAGAFLYNRLSLEAAEVHEQRLGRLLTVVGRQGSGVSGRFLKYEGLVDVLGTATRSALLRGDDTPPEALPPALADRFVDAWADPARAPDDLHPSPRYGTAVSLTEPVALVAPDVAPESVLPTLDRLEEMRHYPRQIMLRSHSDEAATWAASLADRLLDEVGTPIGRVHVGLEDGLYLGYPGHKDFPPRFDPRKRTWYELGRGSRSPTWGSPHADLHSLGLVLPCAVAVRDDAQRLLSVVALDIPFDHIIAELLVTEDFPDSAEAFLLDEQGRIMVRSSKRGVQARAGVSDRTIAMPTFPIPEVVAAVEGLRSGYVEDGDELIVYNRLQALQWYYVVQGPAEDLLDWEGKD